MTEIQKQACVEAYKKLAYWKVDFLDFVEYAEKLDKEAKDYEKKLEKIREENAKSLSQIKKKPAKKK